MPPKASRHQDDSKADAAGTKEKSGGQQSSTKMRRIASQTGGAQSRESKAANATASAAAAQAAAADTTAPSLHWSSFDRDTLHTYRREHNLDTPTSFASSYHETVLSQPGGIGQYSPTMVRKRQARRRQGKDKLAMAVRKHFNGRGIQENDVIVDLLYKIRAEKAAKTNSPNKQVVFRAE